MGNAGNGEWILALTTLLYNSFFQVDAVAFTRGYKDKLCANLPLEIIKSGNTRIGYTHYSETTSVITAKNRINTQSEEIRSKKLANFILPTSYFIK